MTEHDLQNKIRLALSEFGGVSFRTNAGDYWQGQARFSREFNQNVLVNLRRVKGLPDGFSDLLWIGKNNAAFIEVKTTRGIVTKEQKHFLEMMKSFGHNAGVARSEKDALSIVGGLVGE